MKPEDRQRIRWRQIGGVLAAAGLLGLGNGLEGQLRREEAMRDDGWLGIRAVAADFAWIGVQAAWERQDPVATTAAIQRAVTWDPERSLFWINGARMIAYDLAAWRIAEAGGSEVVSGAAAQRWRDEQSRQALALLAKARVRHPWSVDLAIEEGNIELWGRGNVAAAANAFGRAASLPGAPDYALRLEIGLLWRSGQRSEALQRLKRVAALNADNPNSPVSWWIKETMELYRREL